MGAVVSQIQSTANLEVKIHDSRVKMLESLFTKTEALATVQEKPRAPARSQSRDVSRSSGGQTVSAWPTRAPSTLGFKAFER